MPKRTSLEADLTALTEEFVARIVATLKSASFADVASLSPAAPSRGRIEIPRPSRSAPAASPKTTATRTRRGAGERAEVAERLADVLRKASEPLGVRALADALGVAPEKLAAPLKELRDAGRVKKHGDKRSTTYSAS